MTFLPEATQLEVMFVFLLFLSGPAREETLEAVGGDDRMRHSLEFQELQKRAAQAICLSFYEHLQR